MKAAIHPTKPGRKAITRTQRQELRRPTSSLGHAERALKKQRRAATRRLQEKKMGSLLASQETPAAVLANRAESPTLGGVPGYIPGAGAWIMPDDFVRVTPRENVLGNQDSGDLTMVHFARHTFWAEHDEAEAAEEEQFASLYPHLAAVAVEPSRGPRRRNQKGQFCSTSRWPDDFVREVRPDSDELVHLGLTSDEDEFGGRALKGAALLR